ncbi:MAG: plasmid pRiA4b ORF-3 family protein [Planctomycetota bacterium]
MFRRVEAATVPRKSAQLTTTAAKILQLKVTLDETTPAVWRRVQVSSEMTLDQLALVIELAMGWDGDHMHQFEKDRAIYGVPDGYGDRTIDESEVTVGSLLPRKKSWLTYMYDFGDSWRHEVRVEETLDATPNVSYPQCVGGARACPPEDCGGIGGYFELLEEVEEGGGEDGDEEFDLDFDPDAFDVAAVNKRLKRVRATLKVSERVVE